MAHPEDLAVLALLLSQLFEVGELRRFAATLPDSGDLEIQLPGATATSAEVTFAIIKGLDARGLLDTAFFARLRVARVRRAAEIDALAARFITPRADALPRSHSASVKPILRAGAVAPPLSSSRCNTEREYREAFEAGTLLGVVFAPVSRCRVTSLARVDTTTSSRDRPAAAA